MLHENARNNWNDTIVWCSHLIFDRFLMETRITSLEAVWSGGNKQKVYKMLRKSTQIETKKILF